MRLAGLQQQQRDQRSLCHLHALESCQHRAPSECDAVTSSGNRRLDATPLHLDTLDPSMCHQHENSTDEQPWDEPRSILELDPRQWQSFLLSGK
eukprot:Skav235875  [mRNA]  locus=scaffold1192:36376:36657:+ [translate_table: standard]